MRRFWKYIVGVCVATLIIAGIEVSRMPDGQLHVYFLDVGQGDSILIRTPGGELVMVDGGVEDAVLFELGEVLPFFERTIDLIILSHPDKDHIEGFIAVLDRYDVSRVMMTGVESGSPFYKAFLERVRDEGAEILISTADRDLELGGVFWDVLYPFESLFGIEPADQNAASIVVKLVVGDFSVLLTGDSDLAAEAEMLAAGVDVRADILKLGHHGSRTATGDEFLEAVAPDLAIVSAGRENSYGHPHLEVLKKLIRAGISVRRTDEEGRVEVIP